MEVSEERVEAIDDSKRRKLIRKAGDPQNELDGTEDGDQS